MEELLDHAREMNVRLSMSVTRGVGSALLAGALLLAAPAPASAESNLRIDVTGTGFGAGPPGAMLDFDQLLPGDEISRSLRVWNDGEDDVQLSLALADLVDGENGCPEPEWNDGKDDTCGVGQGELSRWLNLTVVRTDGGETTLWQGSFADLVAGRVLAEVMPAGAVWDLRIDLLLRPETSNVTMTDEVAFTLAWSARGGQPDIVEQPGGVQPPAPGQAPGGVTPPGDDSAAPPPAVGGEVTGEAEIAGVASTRPRGSVAGTDAVALPFTGATVAPWMLWFGSVLVGGGALMLASSARLRRNLSTA